MTSVTLGYGFPPTTYCTWLPKVRGKPWVPPANRADGHVLMGEQQDLKDLGKIWAPSIQVFHLKGGSAALWLMSNEGLEEKNKMFMQQAKHRAHSFLGSWAPISGACKYGGLPHPPPASSSSRAALCYGPARSTVNPGCTSDTAESCSYDWLSSTPQNNTKMLIHVSDRKAQCNILQPVITANLIWDPSQSSPLSVVRTHRAGTCLTMRSFYSI